MITKRKLALAVTASLLGTPALLSSNLAFAQANEADDDVEKIAVTGSRIKRTDL